MVVSNPWKLEVSNAFLKSTYIGLNVYSKTMGSNMLRLFEAHKDQVTKNTSIRTEDIHKCKYLHDFDRVVQCATVSEPASFPSLTFRVFPFTVMASPQNPKRADLMTVGLSDRGRILPRRQQL